LRDEAKRNELFAVLDGISGRIDGLKTDYIVKGWKIDATTAGPMVEAMDAMVEKNWDLRQRAEKLEISVESLEAEVGGLKSNADDEEGPIVQLQKMMSDADAEQKKRFTAMQVKWSSKPNAPPPRPDLVINPKRNSKCWNMYR